MVPELSEEELTRNAANKEMQKIVDEHGSHIALSMLASAVASTPDFEQRDNRIVALADEIDAEDYGEEEADPEEE